MSESMPNPLADSFAAACDTYRGGFNVYPLFRGRWQASAGWAVPGEAADGRFVGDWPHFAASPSMSRRRCKRWVKRLAAGIKKGQVR